LRTRALVLFGHGSRTLLSCREQPPDRPFTRVSFTSEELVDDGGFPDTPHVVE
jgi:hypothetical protein